MAEHVIEISVGKDGLKEATVKRLVKLLQKDLGKEAEVSSRKVEHPTTRAERCSAAFASIADGKSELEALQEELESWRDGMPENLQDGEKAQQLDEAISELEDIVGELTQLEDKDGSIEFPAMM